MRSGAGSIARFGGATGVRQPALLESAAATRQVTFGRQSPYTDIVEGAAAYLFYICRNHSFVDGNTRAAAGGASSSFGWRASARAGQFGMGDLTVAVAASEANRERTTERLRQLLAKRKKPKKTRCNEKGLQEISAGP